MELISVAKLKKSYFVSRVVFGVRKLACALSYFNSINYEGGSKLPHSKAGSP
jgi:hypothetical protein